MKILTILFFWSSLSLAGEINLDEMPADVRSAAGISKLTPEELKVLSDWINQRDIELDRAEEKSQVGLKKNITDDDTEIVAEIVGFRNQLNGKMVFELDNGQHWQQSRAQSIGLRLNQTNSVVIKPKAFGSWSMYINGQNKGYKVKRIK